MAKFESRSAVVHTGAEWRLKTDEEIEEMSYRPWLCGCGDEVDDGKPRRCTWLYRPWCRNPSLDRDREEGAAQETENPASEA